MTWDYEDQRKKSEFAGWPVAGRPGKGDCNETKVSTTPESMKMLELELENLRLTRLVADLLLKNQQLRSSR